MTSTEQRYAQIDKEALAITWACDRFSDYLIGLQFHVETDHKPLVPLLSVKRLDELPLHVQRFRMRMLWYHFTIFHVPGKNLIMADTLSRAPEPGEPDQECPESEMEAYVDAMFTSIPATERRMEEIRQHQEEEPIIRQLQGLLPDRVASERSYPRCSNALSWRIGRVDCGERITYVRIQSRDSCVTRSEHARQA